MDETNSLRAFPQQECSGQERGSCSEGDAQDHLSLIISLVFFYTCTIIILPAPFTPLLFPMFYIPLNLIRLTHDL